MSKKNGTKIAAEAPTAQAPVAGDSSTPAQAATLPGAPQAQTEQGKAKGTPEHIAAPVPRGFRKGLAFKGVVRYIVIRTFSRGGEPTGFRVFEIGTTWKMFGKNLEDVLIAAIRHHCKTNNIADETHVLKNEFSWCAAPEKKVSHAFVKKVFKNPDLIKNLLGTVDAGSL